MDYIFEKIILMQEIISVLLDNTDEEGLSRISQTKIADQINKSSSLVSQILRKLEKYDKCIEKVGPAIYKVNHVDFLNYGPISRVIKYYKFIEKDVELIMKPFKIQSELMGMSIEEIQMAQGYLYSSKSKL